VPKKNIIAVLVSNDLVTDQRVQKMCKSLVKRGYEPILIGRKRRQSLVLPNFNFKAQRLNLLFETGMLFYASLNLRLFFKLLFMKLNGIHANDLDTLLPAYLVSKIRSKPLVYDSHEYFTGVPELVNRPRIQKVWRSIEAFIFPKLKHVITVNESIADLYEKDYGNRPVVIRNIPEKAISSIEKESRENLELPDDKFIIILQGNGINVQRGVEEAVQMMEFLEGCLLLIAGSGDVIPWLKEMVIEQKLSEKVRFLPRMPYSQLMQITAVCDLGLSLDKDTNINYRFSLPNKLFDYIHAGIPVLASDLPEVKKIVESYSVGKIAPSHDPKELSRLVDSMRNDKTAMENYKLHCKRAAVELTWDQEAEVLKRFYF
jgi:glycosyltransferase involved in cell wall biosynthesis